MTLARGQRAVADPVITAPRPVWTWQRFDDLSGRDVYDLLALRSQVFVVEQACPFLDTDYCDQPAWHLLGRVVDDSGDAKLAAYLRAIDAGIKYDEPSIGRVIVAEAWRGQGLGRVLMREGIARARILWPRDDIVIGAQQRLEDFYRSLGFAREGEVYDEDGIDHIRMRLPNDR
jgi:ElaA protein